MTLDEPTFELITNYQGMRWVCLHPGFDSGIEQFGMLPVHPCSAKAGDPDLDPWHVKGGHKEAGCGWMKEG